MSDDAHKTAETSPPREPTQHAEAGDSAAAGEEATHVADAPAAPAAPEAAPPTPSPGANPTPAPPHPHAPTPVEPISTPADSSSAETGQADPGSAAASPPDPTATAEEDPDQDDPALAASSQAPPPPADPAEQADAAATDEPSGEEAEAAEEEVTSQGAIEAEEISSEGAVEEDLEAESEEEIQMDWYILKVQSNRERSIADALQRKISVEGLDRFFGQVIVPTEKVTEFKGGKKRVVERKLYPGYIVVHMHINDDTWFAVRETSGIGDFTGAAGKPTPMLPTEVSRIVRKDEEETTEEPKLDIKFKEGDTVKITEGNFENFEGEVSGVDEASGRVTVMINIFGRSTPVQLEYWHLEAV